MRKLIAAFALATLTLTSQENGVTPQDSFQCSGTIYGYLILPKTYVGKHILEAAWIKPDGIQATLTRNEVDFPPPGRSTAMVWFTFPERAPWPAVVDAAQDTERLNFNGRWSLSVRWDDQSLARDTFTVHCY